MEPNSKQPTATRKYYSKDLKERVVYQRLTLGLSTMEIAKNLDMSPRVVQQVLQLYQEIGNVIKDSKTYAKQGRCQLLDTDSVEFLLALLERKPDIYLDELAERLMEQKNVEVSLATIQRSLKMLGITTKKLSKIAAERCEVIRNRFQLLISQESPERLVFTDESAVNMLTTYRTMGRAYKGKRARVKSYFQRGDRYSVLPGLSLNGIVYAQIIQGSFNGSTFKIFLKGLLACMNPYPSPQSVLVMDNCAIHHVEGIQEMCDEASVKLIYLPPYSPDFNPIEECFSFMKSYIRRNGVRFRADIDSGDKSKPYLFLYEALDKVTEDHAKGWFHDSGYL